MTNIRRYVCNNKPVFITAVCYRRELYLKHETAKWLLLDVVREVQSEKPFSMNAYVLLDDHVHWIIHFKDTAKQAMSDIMQSIKLRFTHRFKRNNGITENITIWQRRFWDHIIRDESDLNRHLDYVHFNPVKHGYVEKPVDYPWSSFGELLKRGKYHPDWGCVHHPDSIEGMNIE
jgi:putative transposase